MKLSLLATLAIVALEAQAKMIPQHKRNLLAKRQSISVQDPNTAASTEDPATASTPTSAGTAPTSSGGGLLGGLLGEDSTTGGIGQASSPNPLIPPAQSSASVASSSASESSVSSSRATSSRSTSADVLTTNITSTAANQASQDAQKSEDKDEGSGVGKKTLIIVISVASAVGLVAAIWTILRKWKFSPSRKFEERLNPIDWDPLTEKDNEKVDRSPSVGSGSLLRTNSWGSSRGQAISEVTGYSSRPVPSPANQFNGTAPGYPPSYTSRGYVQEMPQQYPSNHSLTNPYEYPSVTRQGSQVSGGRYGEGYR